jgi:hypothetical protein
MENAEILQMAYEKNERVLNFSRITKDEMKPC